MDEVVPTDLTQSPEVLEATEASELPPHRGGLWLPGGMLNIMTAVDQEGRTSMQMQQGWAFLPVPRHPPMTFGQARLGLEEDDDEAPVPRGPGQYL